MTPQEHAIQWCNKRGYTLSDLKSSKHICEAGKLNALIVDMRFFHWFRWPEIADAVGRPESYCEAVWKESRKKEKARAA